MRNAFCLVLTILLCAGCASPTNYLASLGLKPMARPLEMGPRSRHESPTYELYQARVLTEASAKDLAGPRSVYVTSRGQLIDPSEALRPF